jgi:hypothetical protein
MWREVVRVLPSNQSVVNDHQMNAQGLLVIQNLSHPSRLQTLGEEPHVLCYPSYGEIWHRYRGVGGRHAWPDIGSPPPPLVNGLAPVDAIESCRVYWEAAKKKYPRDKINLVAIGDVEANNEVQFAFLGYDCGYYESEYNHFSAVLNDLLFLIVKEFEPFQHLLNKNLLFQSHVEAEAFLEKRKSLLMQGYPLETDETSFSTIPIHSIV